MSDSQDSLERLRGLIGKEVGLTEWETFDQSTIDAYGAITGENLWIHSDSVRAKASRFGSTIVQASLLMARFGSWIQQVGAWLPEPAVPVNYGYDKVRILGSLPVDAPVRGRVVLDELTEKAGTVRMSLLVEAQGSDPARPVISAQWIVMFLLPT